MNKDLGWLKEVVAAALALGIVAFTLWAMYTMFMANAEIKDGQWQHMSSVLQVAIGLAGTVTGYYFGRIPAEKAAQAATKALNESQTRVAQAETNETRIRSQVELLRKKYGTPVGGTPLGGAAAAAAGGAAAADADALRAQIALELQSIV